MKLADVVKAFATSKEWDFTGALELSAPEADTISLRVKDADSGKQLRISCVYLGSYPDCGCLLMPDDPQHEPKLSAISEKLQDKAPLSTVICKVCEALDVAVDEDALRAVESRIAADHSSATGMDEDAGSEQAMSEDEPGSDGDDDSFSGGSGDEQDDKEMLVQCGQRQGAWTRFEEDMERAEQAKAQQLSMEQGLASRRQIFSNKEGFRMLSNELLGFIRRQDFNVSADSAGDDLYTWNVSLWKSAFKPDCQLAKDLNEVSSKWAVSSIQLRFSFMRGLHPFYPPRVEVVRPHLAAPLPGALAAHPLLRLEHWDPMLNMSQLLDRLQEFLEAHGSIDVNNPRNADEASAFSPVQAALSRLEAIADVKPMCYQQYRDIYDARSTQGREPTAGEPPQQMKKQRTDDAPADEAAAAATGGTAAGAGAAGAGAGAAGVAGDAAVAAAAAAAAAGAANVVWAKGTGYGYGHGRGSTAPVWDAKQAAAAQEAQDEQLCGLLQGLAEALQQELSGASSSSRSVDGQLAAANGAGSSGAAEQQQQQQQQQDHEMTDAAADDGGSLNATQQECLAAVEASVLLPLLARELSTVSFSEMTTRHQYYQPLLAVLQALCRPCAEALLAVNVHSTEQPEPAAAAAAAAGASAGTGASSSGRASVLSVVGALRGLVKSTGMYRDRMAKVLEAQQAAAGSSGAAGGSSSGTGNTRAEREQEALLKEARRSMQIADSVLLIHSKLQHLTPAEDAAVAAAAAASAPAAAAAGQRGGRATRRTTRASSRNTAAAAADGAAGSSAAAAAAAQPQSYEQTLKAMVLDTGALASRHIYQTEAARDPMGLKARVQRVTSEMAAIERMIVVSECSSIFVRVDDDNSFLWKALITGPEDTPYSGGCFIFDMFFPPNYPAVPPKVLLRTTGNGSVRFNPNLYNCGKVCLSLLGTWSGGQGESWAPEASSAFQVLVSIQSLILVPEPYFNEPGYEQRSDTRASNEYNKPLREATIKWAMLDQLKHPPSEFADVIKAHFRLRGPYLLQQVQDWIDEATREGSGPHAARLQALRIELDGELKKLAA